MNSQFTKPPSHQSVGLSQRFTTVLLFLILLLAAGTRFCGLDAQSLWNDEGTSVAVAQRHPATIVHDVAHDIHPPLYYLLLGSWVRLVGTGEAGVRSLSALLAVGLVALTYALGHLLAGRWVGLVAALLAAVSPFQIYYAQEARMYMLLAVLAAGVMLVLARLVDRQSVPAYVALVLLEAAGLYTHYSFLFVLLVLNLAYALWLALTWRRGPALPSVLNWVLSQLAVPLIYLPWLPTAIRQVTAWPSPAQDTAFLPALVDTWRWLAFGPTSESGQVAVPLLVVAVLATAGAWCLATGRLGVPHLRGRWSAGLLVLWLGLPVLLMFALGLYRPAYLKFLLVATPALGLLSACGLVGPMFVASDVGRYGSRALQVIAALFILVPTAFALRNYYADPAYARDDYRGIAAYLDAVGRPGDAVLLNAPGQQEVMGYYYHGDLPVHPLPQSRPLDPEATEASLRELAQPGGRVFSVLWATDESDPERFIESWLDAHAYKALDTWYGNVRLVVYGVPERAPNAPDHLLNVRLRSQENGDEITLLGYSPLTGRLAAGDIAQISLFWQTDQTLNRRYKVFLHVLDAGDHIVGQRDAEPGGGAWLTTLWEPDEVVADNYGLPIHPATPPGVYRVEAGMYDAETGQRLVTTEGEDRIWLEPLVVERPAAPAPVAALGMMVPEGADFGDLALLGYDAYKLGFAHEPGAPLRVRDVLHVNLYWRANNWRDGVQLGGDWQVVIGLVDASDQEYATLTTDLVGGYPTGQWQAGDVWRGQFNLIVPGNAPSGRYRLRLQLVPPDGLSPEPFYTKPLEVTQ